MWWTKERDNTRMSPRFVALAPEQIMASFKEMEKIQKEAGWGWDILRHIKRSEGPQSSV